VSWHLCGEHRRIEQTLVLLDPNVDMKVLARVLADLSLHLSAEEACLYPALERFWSQRLPKLRLLHRRMRFLLARIPSARRAVHGGYLHTLGLTFREHARLVEEEALPALERTMSTAALERLGQRLRKEHATHAPRRASSDAE
jgi:hypothetical protein